MSRNETSYTVTYKDEQGWIRMFKTEVRTMKQVKKLLRRHPGSEVHRVRVTPCMMKNFRTKQITELKQ